MILDVGGVETFWAVAGIPDFAHITIVNVAEAFEKSYWFPGTLPSLALQVGTAFDLSSWNSERVDVVVSNSVIEHVGDWSCITLAAREIRSVAESGWVQTPAFSFPIEPHFALPFVHWFAPPLRAEILRRLPHHGAGDTKDIGRARMAAEENNLLTANEMRFLFPDATLTRERFLGLTKSLIVKWGRMA